MRILGISALYHDSAAAVVVDGEVAAAAQEERFTRKKHDARFPRHAIAYCAEHCGCKVSDFDAVVFYEKPLIKFERLLETYLSFAPRGFSSFRMAMPVWLREKLFQKRLLAKELQKFAPEFDAEKQLLFSEHHLSHAASAFYPSPFEEAAVLTMDGVGEWSTTSLALGQGKDLKVLKEMHFPHSIGLLYSAFTYYLGFKVNSGEYKVMGLAPYGEPEVRAEDSRRDRRPQERRLVPPGPEVLRLLHRPDHDQRRVRAPVRPAGARSRLRAADPVPHGHGGLHPGGDGGGGAAARPLGARRDRATPSVPGRRRGAQLRRQRQDPARGHLRGAVGAAGLGRCRRRAGRGAGRLSHLLRSPAQAQRRGPRRHARLLSRAGLRAGGNRDGVDGGGRQVRDARRERSPRDDGAGAGRRQGRRLDAGPHGVRTPGARRALHPGRSALADHAENTQPQGQISRELPALRALRAARGGRRLVRARRRLALHAAGCPRA